MNAGFNVWSEIVYIGRYGSLYQQTATYSYKGTPLCYELKINSGDGTYKLWNSRIKTGAKFRVWAGYCGRVKVVKCHRKELEGKTIDTRRQDNRHNVQRFRSKRWHTDGTCRSFDI